MNLWSQRAIYFIDLVWLFRWLIHLAHFRSEQRAKTASETFRSEQETRRHLEEGLRSQLASYKQNADQLEAELSKTRKQQVSFIQSNNSF